MGPQDLEEAEKSRKTRTYRMKPRSFTKAERIRKNAHFMHIRKNGISYRGSLFGITVCRNNIGFNRIGISVSSSKVPTAVNRNRIKRLIREFFRQNKSQLSKKSNDIIFYVWRNIDKAISYREIEKNLMPLIVKAKLI